MKAKHSHILTAASSTTPSGLRRWVQPFLAVASCVLVAACAGCGIRPQPVNASDVSPVQLSPRARHRQAAKADEPATQRTRIEPVREMPQAKVAPVMAKRQAEKAPKRAPVREQIDELLRQQEAVPTEPAQPPAPQTEPAEPATPTKPLQQEPGPAPVPAQELEIPLFKEPGMADELITVNFDGVDIRDVIKTVGELTGINFILAESVSGKVTVMSPTPIRLGDLYSTLQSILDVSGYAAIETVHAVKIVPKPEAAKSSLQVRVGADPAYIPKDDALVTQIMPLVYADADDVKQIVQPILSTGAQMSTYARTNTVMVTDTSANIHYIAQIIKRLDVEGSREKVSLFPLQHASAQVLSDQITRILDKAQGATAPAGRVRTAQALGEGPRVLPDDRTNALIVVADEQDIDTVGQLVRQLDIERPSGTDNIHVLPLRNADANEVAPSLEAAMASMRLTGTVEAAQQIHITPDGSTNSLIVVASPQDYELVSKIVEKLDIVREQVLVEMMILEITEEGLKEIGVDWATLDEAVADSVRGFGMTNLGPRVDFVSGDYEGLAVGAWKGSGDDVGIGAILQALHKESAVNILSTPHILTSNHRRAKIVVGENRAFVTQSRVTETTDFLTPTVIQSYEYKDVGITLEITPHVNQGGLIRLELDTEFTKLIEDVSAPSPETPTTAKRTAQTIVTMNTGATVVIGGLMRDDKTRVQTKVPLVGDVPVVGPLFRSQKDQTQKTNLLIFITPRVMANQEQLLEMTEEKRQEMSSRTGQSR